MSRSLHDQMCPRILCFRDMSSIYRGIFAKLLSLVHLWTQMTWLRFWVKGQSSRSHHRGGGAQHSTLPSSATFSSLVLSFFVVVVVRYFSSDCLVAAKCLVIYMYVRTGIQQISVMSLVTCQKCCREFITIIHTSDNLSVLSKDRLESSWKLKQRKSLLLCDPLCLEKNFPF